MDLLVSMTTMMRDLPAGYGQFDLYGGFTAARCECCHVCHTLAVRRLRLLVVRTILTSTKFTTGE